MAKRQTQFKFCLGPGRSEHGGALSVGRRKTARPLATRRPMHIVMRSSEARGKLSFLSPENAPMVSRILKQTAQRFRIKLFKFANSGNHLHLLIQGTQRKDIQDFLRTTAALIARKITQAKRGQPFGKFWDLPTYSRVVEWGRAFTNVMKYLEQNTLEALGVIPYRARKMRGPGEHSDKNFAR